MSNTNHINIKITELNEWFEDERDSLDDPENPAPSLTAFTCWMDSSPPCATLTAANCVKSCSRL